MEIIKTSFCVAILAFLAWVLSCVCAVYLAAIIVVGLGLVIWVLSCFCPVYWKLPWFASSLQPVLPGDAVVVTGASTGIGKHAALTLVKQGFTVFCGVRKEKDGEALIQAAKRYNLDTELVKPVLLDVVNSAQIASVKAEVEKWLQGRGLKGLFNNAGIGGDADGACSNAVEHVSIEHYRQVMDVNFFGMVETTQAFLPLLRKGKGRIVINTSVAGLLGNPFQSVYSASKFAAEGFGDSLHREIMHQGMHVAMLEPGFVATPILTKQQANKNITYDKVNYPQEEGWWSSFFAMTVLSKPPKVTSECVAHALRANAPARRYLCGYGTEPLKFATRLPCSWKDLFYHPSVLALRVPKGVTDERIDEYAKWANRDFEL